MGSWNTPFMAGILMESWFVFLVLMYGQTPDTDAIGVIRPDSMRATSIALRGTHMSSGETLTTERDP
jgi:hypothetical protein